MVTMKGQIRRYLAAASVALLCLLALTGTQGGARVLAAPEAPQNDAPSTVFVYNGTADTFNNNAQGYIWQQLGLLDANGRPGTVQGNNVVDSSGKVLGGVIRGAGGAIIGYRNADGSQEAYDVSGGATTAQAWKRVADGGTLHIAKHGASYEDEGGRHEGGGIQLDDGKTYDGFDVPGGGNGTGASYPHPEAPNGPYRLDPRPDAGITLNANSCWSSNDPDGNGPQDSVTGSASDVPGVSGTSGHDNEVEARVRTNLQGPDQESVDAAQQALAAAASQAGFRDENGNAGWPEISQWLSSLPFKDQHSTAQAAVDGAVKPAGTVKVKLSYSKVEVEGTEQGVALIGDVGTSGYWKPPLSVRHSLGTVYAYGQPSPSAWLHVPPGALTAPTMFHVDQLGRPPAPLPPNMVLNSGMMKFVTLGFTAPFATPLEVALRYYDDSAPPTVYRHDAATGWQLLPTKANDPVNKIVMVDTPNLSVFAVLMQVVPGTLVGQATTQFHGPDGFPLTVKAVQHGTVAFTRTVTLDASGTFTVTDVVSGTYDVWIKHAHTLAQRADDVAIVAGGTTTVDFGMLHEGDANGDNLVNTTDFSVWLVAFQGAYDPRADFNLDGMVNTTDFSIWLSNFTMTGDPLFG